MDIHRRARRRGMQEDQQQDADSCRQRPADLQSASGLPIEVFRLHAQQPRIKPRKWQKNKGGIAAAL